MNKQQFIDPKPLGEPGWSLYRYSELRREKTACGGYVPLFILSRVAGPFETPEQVMPHVPAAAAAVPEAGLIILPDGGRVWKQSDPGPAACNWEVIPEHDPRVRPLPDWGKERPA